MGTECLGGRIKRTFLLQVLPLVLPMAVFANNSVDFTNDGGTLSGSSAGLNLSGSTLVAVNSLSGLGLVTGDLGSVTFSTGALAGGSLQMGDLQKGEGKAHTCEIAC